MKRDAIVAAHGDRDRQRDQFLGLGVESVGASAAWAIAENCFIASPAPPRRFPSSALSSLAVVGQSILVNGFSFD
jgi:hypothetical protein